MTKKNEEAVRVVLVAAVADGLAGRAAGLDGWAE